MASGYNQPEKPRKQDEKRHRSIFELPATFFNSCRLLQSPFASPSSVEKLSISDSTDLVDGEESNYKQVEDSKGNINNFSASNATPMNRWSCSTCKAEFESLQEQRSHFKSDIHRLNVHFLSLNLIRAALFYRFKFRIHYFFVSFLELIFCVM